MSRSNTFSIKNWALEDRPREKLLLQGARALSDAELIAILLRSGTHEMSAVDLGRQLLQRAGNKLNNLGKLTVKDLMKHKGIGAAKAVSIVAALELGKRRKLEENNTGQSIKSSKDVYEIFEPLIADLPHEEFWILLLNRSNRIIGKSKISQGGVAGTVIDTKLIMKTAIENLASSIILCHNHPSGNLNPSGSDIEITSKISTAANCLDVKLLDHVIVTDHSYYSFLDEGKL
ncbi:MAG: DNA repair protein RadC [Bacteroidales bacterium]|nr:DNA repair protein RadC [Bacteroidales bacterium]